MAIFVRSKAEKPVWLDEVRQFCRDAGIRIMGWGPDLLTVEAKSRDRAQQIASQLGQFGFKVVENEDNVDAGMLDLSKNHAAIQTKIAAFDISKRRWDDQIVPLIWALGTLLLIPGLPGTDRYRYWLKLPLGLLSLFLFFWDGTRIWGWRLELHPEALRIRRRFRWSTFPWSDIKTIASAPAGGRSQEAVLVHLASRRIERLGTFNCAFARRLRDRLRHELAQRRPH